MPWAFLVGSGDLGPVSLGFDFYSIVQPAPIEGLDGQLYWVIDRRQPSEPTDPETDAPSAELSDDAATWNVAYFDTQEVCGRTDRTVQRCHRVYGTNWTLGMLDLPSSETLLFGTSVDPDVVITIESNTIRPTHVRQLQDGRVLFAIETLEDVSFESTRVGAELDNR